MKKDQPTLERPVFGNRRNAFDKIRVAPGTIAREQATELVIWKVMFPVK